MTRCPTAPRSAQVLALFSMVAALAACGGGGGGGGGEDSPAPPAAGPAVSAPASGSPPSQQATSAARVAGVDLVQGFVFPSTDSSLLLVSNRDVIVKVNVTTTNTAEARPTGTLRIEDGNGTLIEERALTVPSAALQSTVPVVPDFTHFYTATVPASAVKAGLRLTVQLANGQPATVVTPRVGGSNAITFVAVPVRIQGTAAQVFTGAASYLAAQMPVSTVTTVTHAVFPSQKVTALPTTDAQWSTAMRDVLGEMAELHRLENASDRTFYYGFLPKRTYGITGLGYMPGPAAVGIDFPTQPDAVMTTLVHEVGHNFSLPHAPCGVASSEDPAYPYANATLGAGSRFIWGYDKRRNAFVDPRPTTVHDLMSYCDGDTFSDFNYRRMQSYLTPADRLSATGGVSIKSITDAVETGPQELLLVSGRIEGDRAELGNVKSFTGVPRSIPAGAYVLRVVTAAGTVDHPFAPMALDHSSAFLPFHLAIPNPGQVVSMQVLAADGKVLAERRAGSPVTTDRTKAVAAAATTVSETGGVLHLRWDAAAQRSLTVIHVGDTRTVLAQDLASGSADLPTAALAPGGSFELIFSDGLNSVRVTAPRGAGGSVK